MSEQEQENPESKVMSSVSELTSLREEWADKFDEILDRVKEDSSEVNADLIALISKFAEEVIKDKVKFKWVFKTSKGSLYVVASDNSSLRLKADVNLRYQSPVQPVFKRIIFIDHDSVELIKERLRRHEEILGIKLKTIEPQAGAIPLELNLVGYPTETEVTIEEVDGGVILRGSLGFDKEEESVVNGFHIGHPIEQLI